MQTKTRIIFALLIGFVTGLAVSYTNKPDLISSLQAGVFLALITGVAVAMLSWGMDTAEKKGYPGWLGFMLVLVLNVFGVMIVDLLPVRSKDGA
jgi:multisubunit Na+/H+ antiporter MnhB subunit